MTESFIFSSIEIFDCVLTVLGPLSGSSKEPSPVRTWNFNWIRWIVVIFLKRNKKKDRFKLVFPIFLAIKHIWIVDEKQISSAYVSSLPGTEWLIWVTVVPYVCLVKPFSITFPGSSSLPFLLLIHFTELQTEELGVWWA